MSEDGTKREVQHIYVVCGEAGEPHRAYTNREKAEELLEHWRDGLLSVRGSIEAVDLVEFREVNTDSNRERQ